MEGWDEKRNPFRELGLKSGATDKEIKKAWRKLALEKHPDKQPGNKQAAEEFIRLQTAYAILTDEKARAAWEGLQKAKDARDAKQAKHTDKRRKFAQDLERREKEAESDRQEKQAHNKLKAELERIRQEMRANERTAKEKLGAVWTEQASRPYSVMEAPNLHEEAERTLKVQWDETISGYTEQRLREIFSVYGRVVDVISRPSKRKGKGSALVVMADSRGASDALVQSSGDVALGNPLLVLPLNKKEGFKVQAQQDSRQPQRVSTAEQPASTGRNMPGNGAAHQDTAMPPAGRPFPSGAKSLFPSTSGRTAGAQPLFPSSRSDLHRPPGSSVPGPGVYMQSEEALLEKMRRRAMEDKAKQTAPSDGRTLPMST